MRRRILLLIAATLYIAFAIYLLHAHDVWVGICFLGLGATFAHRALSPINHREPPEHHSPHDQP